MKKKKTEREPIQREIPLSQIYEGENVSREYYARIEELAEAIKSNDFWIAPLMVVKEGNAKYRLLSGFRRFKALQLLAERKELPFTDIPCQVHTTISDASGAMLNVTENLVRADITFYELIKACTELHGRFGLPVKTIAKRIDKKESTVSNYIRMYRLLHPTILQALRNAGANADQVAPQTTLLTWAGMDHEDQLTQYESRLNAGGNQTNSGDSHSRMKRKKEILKAITELRQIGDDECKFAAEVLKWVLGEVSEPW